MSVEGRLGIGRSAGQGPRGSRLPPEHLAVAFLEFREGLVAFALFGRAVYDFCSDTPGQALPEESVADDSAWKDHHRLHVLVGFPFLKHIAVDGTRFYSFADFVLAGSL